jgi:arginyl-tRNA--protein-N-Asp/Glu arginylyltransferase
MRYQDPGSPTPANSPDSLALDEVDLAGIPLARSAAMVSPPFPCSYLPNRTAQSTIILPTQRFSPLQWGELLRQSFRRSGKFIYRPQCPQCQSCISVRLPVAKFLRNRSQQRIWDKYQNDPPIKAEILPLLYSSQHFALYQRYQKARHAGSEMDTDSQVEYAQNLLDSSVESRLIEFRDRLGVVRMVSIVDMSDDGASAVYTFYDPDWSGLGVYGILWQCDWLASMQADYLYLGYWIEQAPKMRYKQQFQPLEYFVGQQWIDKITR